MPRTWPTSLLVQALFIEAMVTLPLRPVEIEFDNNRCCLEVYLSTVPNVTILSIVTTWLSGREQRRCLLFLTCTVTNYT